MKKKIKEIADGNESYLGLYVKNAEISYPSNKKNNDSGVEDLDEKTINAQLTSLRYKLEDQNATKRKKHAREFNNLAGGYDKIVNILLLEK